MLWRSINFGLVYDLQREKWILYDPKALCYTSKSNFQSIIGKDIELHALALTFTAMQITGFKQLQIRIEK